MILYFSLVRPIKIKDDAQPEQVYKIIQEQIKIYFFFYYCALLFFLLYSLIMYIVYGSMVGREGGMLK